MVSPSQHGKLTVIFGCMSSGKSEELIRLAKGEVIAKKSVVIFKPKRDTRMAETSIVSRSGQSLEAQNIADITEALDSVRPDCDVVCLDEAQFFDLDGELARISFLQVVRAL